MAIRKPIAVALSTVALAGVTAFASGAATPASAQTLPTTSQHPVAVQGCDWRWENCHHRHGWNRWHHHDRWHHRHHGGWGGW